MEDFIISMIASVIASLLAIIGTMRFEWLRMPKLTFQTSESANKDGVPKNGISWKFFRVEVKNEKLSSFFGFPRQTAENCRARIEIEKLENDTFKKISFLGRWASTPEIPYNKSYETFYKLQNPEPVSILAGQSELLDIFTKPDDEMNAYGWNNESYAGWKNGKYLLQPGEYRIKIVINTQNGNTFSSFVYLKLEQEKKNIILSMKKRDCCFQTDLAKGNVEKNSEVQSGPKGNQG